MTSRGSGSLALGMKGKFFAWANLTCLVLLLVVPLAAAVGGLQNDDFVDASSMADIATARDDHHDACPSSEKDDESHGAMCTADAALAYHEGSNSTPRRRARSSKLQPVVTPLLWMAPFLSGGGYCSEAIEFAAALAGDYSEDRDDGIRNASGYVRPRHLRIAQHGDGVNWGFIQGLPESRVRLLERLLEGDCCADEGKRGEDDEEDDEEVDESWSASSPVPGDANSNTVIDWSSGIIVCHSEPGAWLPSLFQTDACPPAGYEAAAHVIGRTMFETDRVTEEHVKRCNRMDEIWVPSHFHVASFSNSGVIPSKLHVVPQAVDISFFSRQLTPRKPLPEADLAVGPDSLARSDWWTWQWEEEHGAAPACSIACADSDDGSNGGSKTEEEEGQQQQCDGFSPSEDTCGVESPTTAPTPPRPSPVSPLPFVFLSIFKWERRKGWDVLLRSFLLEFTAHDNAALYIHTTAYHSSSDFIAQIKSFIAMQRLTPPAAGWPSVYVHSRHLPQSHLPSLYRAAGAFVLASRGEGWGRPVGEAMAMSLPVIATDWSGLTELLTQDNSYPVSVERMSEVGEGAFMGHLWAEPSERDVRAMMRRVWREREEGREKGRRARRDMERKFSPAVVAEAVMTRLREIERKIESGDKEDR